MASEFSELGHLLPRPLRLVALCGLLLKGPSRGEAPPCSVVVPGGLLGEGCLPTSLQAATVASRSLNRCRIGSGHQPAMPTTRAARKRTNICDYNNCNHQSSSTLTHNHSNDDKLLNARSTIGTAPRTLPGSWAPAFAVCDSRPVKWLLLFLGHERRL